METKQILGMAAVAVLSAAGAGATTWNPTADFSVEHGNPNGVWSYGWENTVHQSFTLFTRTWGTDSSNPQWGGWAGDRTPCIWLNTDAPVAGVPTGSLSIHPGPGNEPSVLRWTAPAGVNGTASVEGEFLAGDGGWMTVGIFVNGSTTPVWDCGNAGAFDLDIPVHPGDTIDFAVYGGYYSGNTPIALEITVPDGGSSLLLLGGAWAMALAARRRRTR